MASTEYADVTAYNFDHTCHVLPGCSLTGGSILGLCRENGRLACTWRHSDLVCATSGNPAFVDLPSMALMILVTAGPFLLAIKASCVYYLGTVLLYRRP